MLTIIILILILSFLILCHEFGHFITAKKVGVRVEEFGVGLPPRIFSKKFKETIYSINLLPFGGFVKLTGEDEEKLPRKKDHRNFMFKKPGQRAMILFAGVFMNLVLGVFLYYTLLTFNGFKTLTFPLFFDYHFRFGSTEKIKTVVMSFDDESPAQAAGVETGEAVIEIDNAPVYSVLDVRRELENKAGKEVKVLLMDVRTTGRDLRSLTMIPRENGEGKGVIGVLLSDAVTLNYGYGRQKYLAGFLHAYNMFGYTTHTLGNLIGLSFQTKDITPVSDSVSGPVGVFSVVQAILSYKGREKVLGILDLTALLSLSLAFINTLPFPALDGGRLIFIAAEKVFGRRILPKFETAIHRWGMVFLLALLVLVTIRDIGRIFG